MQPAIGTPRTQGLRAKLAMLNGHGRRGRSRRFLENRDGYPAPNFASVAAVPNWMLMDDAAKRGIAKSVALLVRRDAIDRELSGKRLGALADAVGHQILEALCDCPAPEVRDIWGRSGLLPRPEDLEELGSPILEAALPLSLKDRYPGATDDANARALVTIATRIWQQCQGSPAEGHLE